MCDPPALVVMASPSQTPECWYFVEISSLDPIKILLFMVTLCITCNIRVGVCRKQRELPSGEGHSHLLLIPAWSPRSPENRAESVLSSA